MRSSRRRQSRGRNETATSPVAAGRWHGRPGVGPVGAAKQLFDSAPETQSATPNCYSPLHQASSPSVASGENHRHGGRIVLRERRDFEPATARVTDHRGIGEGSAHRAVGLMPNSDVQFALGPLHCSPGKKNPRTSGDFSDGASRARTGDLLGAIPDCLDFPSVKARLTRAYWRIRWTRWLALGWRMRGSTGRRLRDGPWRVGSARLW